MKLPIGKLDSKLLEDIVFDKIHHRRKEVVQRPGIGEDCAVVNYGDYDCILSTDPITGAVSEIGRLAVNITLNDIASNGVEPLGILLAVMLPEGTTEADVEMIMGQAGTAADQMNVEIIGGHTEITAAVKQPVIVSTAIGKCPAGKSVDSSRIQVGDVIMMTKDVGLEGIGIIASDRPDKLSTFLSPEEIQEARAMLENTNVVKEGIIAGQVGVSGMHDITEGGVLGAVWEMCETSGLGAEIFFEKLPIPTLSDRICKEIGIDILRLISSGCMLMVVPPDKKDALSRKIEEAGIRLSEIGRMTERGVFLIREGEKSEIAPPQSDELYRALE